RQLQVRTQAPAQARQRLAEGDGALELAVAAGLAPLRVVAVLLAAARIAARRLHMAVGAAADPDVGVRRRDRQRTDPRQRRGVADHRAVGVAVAEAGAGTATGDARFGVADIHQARLLGGLAAGVVGILAHAA